MKDRCLSDTDLIKLVAAENESQLRKWGVQNHSPFEWLTYTAEMYKAK